MRYISYRWAPYTVFKGEPPREGNSTLVEFLLSRAGDNVRLQVIESGFDALDTAEDQRRKAAEDNSRGWEFALADLKQRAEAPAA
jgi:hypothetical protein